MAELDGQRVAVAGFGPAALSCATRHRFTGWSREQHHARLIHIADNQRDCVLPGGQRHNLAPAVLTLLLLRLPAGYLAACGHRMLAAETFTDRPATPAPATRRTSARPGRRPATAAPPGPGILTAAPSGSGPTRCTAARRRSCPPSGHPLLTREEPRVINLNALPLAGDPASLLEVLGGLTDPAPGTASGTRSPRR